MSEKFIERDCVFEAHGRKFEEGGACYNGEHIRAYLSDDMTRVRTWHGDDLGPAKVIKSWPMPHSWQSSRQYQVECLVNNVVYTGRTMGGGMIYSGKRKKSRKPGDYRFSPIDGAQ